MIALSAELLAKVCPASYFTREGRNYLCIRNGVKRLPGRSGQRAAILTSASMSTMSAARPKRRPAQIILGSSSRTRQEILTEMGYEFEIEKAGIDEQAIRRERPEDLVMALAEAKADAIRAKLAAQGRTFLEGADPPTLLITADQVVVHEGTIFEKPASEEEARRNIQGFSRSPAGTVGALLVTDLGTGRKRGGLDVTQTFFHPIPSEVVEKLVKDPTTYMSAGGLQVEHPLVVPYVKSMIGTQDSVMGLPKALLTSLIEEVMSR